MNFKVKVLVIVLICFQTLVNAQDKFAIMPTVGISTPILDNGTGLHLGLNPSYAVSEYFALEGQISYNYTQVTGGFISGETSTRQTGNALAGGRLYILSSERKIRPYINLLVGGMLHSEQEDEISDPVSEFGLGFSAGAFVEVNKFVVGISLETPDNFILKIGYAF